MAARPRLHRMMMSGLPTIVLPLTPLDMMAARPRLHRMMMSGLPTIGLPLTPLDTPLTMMNVKTLAGYLAGRSTWHVMITQA